MLVTGTDVSTVNQFDRMVELRNDRVVQRPADKSSMSLTPSRQTSDNIIQ